MRRKITQLKMALILTTLSFCGCISDNYSSVEEKPLNVKNLNLQAPSGEFIAKDLHELKEMLEPIKEKSVDFDILSIKFDSLTVGFIAEIEYRTDKGYQSNVLIIKRDEDEQNK